MAAQGPRGAGWGLKRYDDLDGPTKRKIYELFTIHGVMKKNIRARYHITKDMLNRVLMEETERAIHGGEKRVC